MSVFSLLIATYNHERFIEECIMSVINQSFTDWEMIILDDGSTDDTGVIANKWASSDRRIHYVYQTNKGIFRLFETNNSGLDMSRGKYISILEGNDSLDKQKLQLQYVALKRNSKKHSFAKQGCFWSGEFRPLSVMFFIFFIAIWKSSSAFLAE
ncbi:MAG: glycosyltransferase family A protein [Bacteroidetes bacterium]|nr:glycosyltransferase family A protein [Bacteroidota bacterium]